MAYDVTGTFNAIDNISNIASGIGGNISSMAQQGIDALGSLSESGFGVAELATAGLTLGVGALIAVVGESIGSMVEMDTAMNNISATTGMTGQNLASVRGHAEELFNTGLVSNFQDAANAAGLIDTKLKGLTLTSGEAVHIGTDALAISQAWGVSSDKIITSVGNMTQKFDDLKNDPLAAMDLLTKAAQDTQLPLQKIMSIVDQYGGVFNSAGLSGQDSMALITQASENGVTNMAALSKSVDTFHQRIINPPSGFEKAMTTMGLGKVSAELKSNKIDMTTALDDVYAAFAKMPDSAEKSQLAIDIFGKSIDKIDPGKLAGFNKVLGDTKGAADGVANAMDDNLGTAIQKAGNNIKNFLGDKAEEAFQRIKSIDWQKIGDSIGAAFDWAKGIVTQAFANISLAVNTALNIISGLISSAKATISGAFTSITTSIALTWNDWFGGGGKLSSLVASAINSVSGVISGAKSSIVGAISDITSGAGTLWNGLFGASGIISSNAGTALSGAGTAIAGAQQAVSDALSGITGAGSKIWNAFFGPGGGIGNGISTALNVVKTTISGAQGGITDAISAITSAVDVVWKKIFGGSGSITADIGAALQGVIDAANGVVGGVSKAFSAITDAITAALKGAMDFVSKLANAVGSLLHLGGGGGGGVPANAAGGMIPKGMSWVGENGPEMVFSDGSGIARVFSNNTSRAMSGESSGGGGITLNISAGTVVGSNGMNEFSRTIYQKMQAEDYRRGKRS